MRVMVIEDDRKVASFIQTGLQQEGYAVDVLLVPPVEDREFTCADGSGTVVARKNVTRANALFTHEEGVWSIVKGTGRYVELRGKGTSVVDTTSGDPVNHPETRFDEAWTGIVDFDVSRPSLRISKATARHLQRPPRTYVIRPSSPHATAVPRVRFHMT